MSRLGPCRRRLAQGLLLAAALSAWSSRPCALELPLQVSQYAHTAWAGREGADLGIVFAMAQTPDGYLWIAGSLGLFRFDGLRFMPWQPPKGDSLPNSPYSLLASRDGTLWIGTYDGLASWNGREFVRRNPEVGKAFVTSLLEDRDGTVWVGVLGQPGRLCAIRDGRTRCAEPEGGFGGFVWSLAQDRAGALWVGAESGVWRWSPGTPRRHPLPGLRVADLTTTADGQVLAGVMGGGLREVAGDQLVPHALQRPGGADGWLADAEVRANKLLRDRDGGLWIGTQGQGLIHVKDGQADTYARSDGLSGNIAASLFEDREGNIWYGSHKGLDRFRKLPVNTLSAKQGLPDEFATAVVAGRDGSIWVATKNGLARWRDGTHTVYRKGDGLPDSEVHALYEDAEGRLWASTARGLVHFVAGRFVVVDAGASSEIYAMTGDAAGNLWLSGNQGLTHLRQGRVVDHAPWSAFGRKHPARSIVAERGGLWLSFWDRTGVSYVKDGRVEATYASEHGLGDRYVAHLRLDAEGALWAATGSGGLSRIKDGRVATLSVANGLPCNRVHWSMADATGALWVYSVCGLARVSREELSAWIAAPGRRVTPALWGSADGVPLQVQAPNYFNPAVAQSADGKIWSAGVAEVQVFDPAHMPSNPVPPPVHIETLVADHRPYAVAGELRLPPLVRDITIEFAALTLADPKATRFRYRLEGHDAEWQEAVDRRLVTYTNLPPGHYRFRVKAANNSGVWNEQGAQLEFSILPAVYQTTWFRVGCAALLTALAWAGFRLWLHMRIRRLQRQFEATLEARVAERTRIARELHDTLLQRFHGLLLLLQAGANLLPDRPRESKQVFARAIDQAAEAITEGRDAVQALRAPARETSDLTQALRALAAELAKEGAEAQVNVEVQGVPRPLQPLVREEAYHVAGEALRNALAHAQARQVSVEIRYEPRQLQVRVRDDGQGIDAEVLRSGGKQGHFGLGGMRERAELVGGTLSLDAAPGRGTEVRLTVPGARAYDGPAAARSWLGRWRFPSAGINP